MISRLANEKPKIAPDIARALLDADPELRAQGLNTGLLLDQANKDPAAPRSDDDNARGPLIAELKLLKQQWQKASARRDAEIARANADLDKVRAQIREKAQRLLQSGDRAAAAKAEELEREFLAALEN
jgi:hypothetical protein